LLITGHENTLASPSDYGTFILKWELSFPNGLTHEKSRFAKPMGNGKEFSSKEGFVQSNDTTMKI
jgi:hypothetical protein